MFVKRVFNERAPVYIDVYLERTKVWRKNEGQLFLSFISPHKFVTTQTDSRWILKVLSLSGTDTSVFKAHSVFVILTVTGKISPGP